MLVPATVVAVSVVVGLVVASPIGVVIASCISVVDETPTHAGA